MKHYAIYLILVIFMSLPLTTHAADTADFGVKTTEDLLDLCASSPESNFYTEATNFCYGYMVGAYHYHTAIGQGSNAQQQICVPEPKPLRDEVIALFVEWAKANPQYHNESPIKTEFRFLKETWPCDR